MIAVLAKLTNISEYTGAIGYIVAAHEQANGFVFNYHRYNSKPVAKPIAEPANRDNIGFVKALADPDSQALACEEVVILLLKPNVYCFGNRLAINGVDKIQAPNILTKRRVILPSLLCDKAALPDFRLVIIECIQLKPVAIEKPKAVALQGECHNIKAAPDKPPGNRL